MGYACIFGYEMAWNDLSIDYQVLIWQVMLLLVIF